MRIKRFIAILLALTMMATLVPAAVFSESTTYQLAVANKVVVDGTSDQTVEVYFQSIGAENTYSVEAFWSTSETEESSYLTLSVLTPTGVTATNNNPETGRVYWTDTTLSAPISTEAGGTIWTATYTVDKDTPAGFYTVSFAGKSTDSTYGENNFELTATIEVAEPAPATPDYQIYYTLDATAADSDGDKYKEYAVGSNVTATVYLKNNKEATVLQAYDVYLTHDDNLTYTGVTGNGVEVFNSDADANDGLKEAHIQFVADKENQKSLGTTDPVVLGTISFTVADAAVYADPMPITLIQGSEEQGEETTNIAIGGTSVGDATAYYPTVQADVLGAETNTTHTVKFNTLGGTVIADKTVGHNLTVAQPADPEKIGYSFEGWYADSEYKTVFNFGTLITKDTEIFAKWATNTVKVTWMNGTTQLGQDDVTYNTVPAYSGETPTKTDPTGQYTYTFDGWSATDGGAKLDSLPAATVDTTYYAVFTSEVNKYDITWLKQDGSALDKDEDIAWGTDLNTIAPTAPDKAADKTYTYAFAGWAKATNAESGTAAADLGKVTGDVTYYAAYAKTPIEYTVTYSDDGTTSTTTANYNGTVELPAAKGKTGYTFDGWFYGDEEIGAAGAEYTVTGDIELTAKYTIVNYTITYEENGGDTVADGTYTVEDTVTLPSIKKEGATFGGWFENSDLSGSPVTEIAKGTTGNKTYYAMWTDNDYSILKADVDNGAVNAINSKDNTTSANKGDIITVTVDPDDGYDLTADTVIYTHVDENGEPILDDNGDPITGTINVTKQDNGTYTGSFNMPASHVKVSAEFKAIDYKVEVGAVSNGTVTIQDGEDTTNKLEPVHIGETITLNVTPKDGYQIVSVTYTPEGGTAKTINGSGNVYTFEMPAANVTVSAEFEAISYTITYNTNGGSAIEQGSYTVENAVTLPTNTEKVGYNFGGWYDNEDLSGTAVAEILAGSTENKTFWAKWNPKTDTAYTVNHYQQKLGGDADVKPGGYDLAETEKLTGTTDSKVTPERESYTGFTAPDGQEVTIAADGSTVVNYYYTRNTYSINLDEVGGSYVDGVTEPTSYIYGTTVTLPDGGGITKAGHTFDGWYDTTGNKVTEITATDTGNKSLTARWTIISYEIKLELAGGALETGTANPISYNINSTVTLPTPTKAYYTFTGWKVTDGANPAWPADSVIGTANLAVSGKYGNVTLTAQWNRAATPVVEQYKYSLSGYWMLRVADTGLNDGQEYKFNSESMFYMSADEDVNGTYLLGTGDAGVFYTLISGDYVEDGALTDAGYNLLTIGDAASTGRATINYDGDINADGVVNIADANVVYQMVEQTSMGGYYTDTQLDTEARLKADMNTAKGEGTDENRGSIADVEAIVNIINGVTQ